MIQNSSKPIYRLFLRYIIPAVVSQWVFTLYVLVDGFFVARGVSETALAAVNLSSPFITAVFSFSLMFAVGTSTIVAFFHGKGKMREANEVFTQNIVLLTLIAAGMSLLLMLNLERVCVFLGAEGDLLPYVMSYLGAIIPFTVFFILSYSFEILIATDGFPTSATVIVSLGVALNFIMDYLFIFRFSMEVYGAALATSLSQTCVIVFYLIHFLRKKGKIHFVPFKWKPSLIGREIRNGFSSGLTELSSGWVTFLYNRAIMAFLTAEALVSYTLIYYINIMLTVAMIGISQGCQPLISFYRGKNEKSTIRKLLKYEFAAAIGTGILGFLLAQLLSQPFADLYISADMPGLRLAASEALRKYSFAFLLMGVNIILAGYFAAIEKARSAVLISLCRSFVFLPLFLILFGFATAGSGIWYAALAAEAVTCGISAWQYKRNAEKNEGKTL